MTRLTKLVFGALDGEKTTTSPRLGSPENSLGDVGADAKNDRGEIP